MRKFLGCCWSQQQQQLKRITATAVRAGSTGRARSVCSAVDVASFLVGTFLFHSGRFAGAVGDGVFGLHVVRRRVKSRIGKKKRPLSP